MSRAEFMRTPASQPHHDGPHQDDGPEPVPDQGQHRPSAPPPASSHRHTHDGGASHSRPVRQRPIRVTLTVLFLVPLISLIALWGYAATGTISDAITKRNSDTANKDIGGPAQALLLQLAQEGADTFIWQSAHGLIPRSTLNTQRAHTDAAVSAFNAGTAATEAAGAETNVSRPGIAALSSQLGQLGQIRAGVDVGTTQPLTAFQDYNGIIDAFFPFARGSLTAPDGSLPLYQQGEAVIDEAQALELIGQEGALVGGALASGGVMTRAEHQLFVQAVNNQRYLEQTAQSPFYWQESADPYPRVFASGTYQNFKAMEDQIAAARAGTRLNVSPLAWEGSVESVVAALNQAETVGRLGVTRGTAHAGNVILLRLFLVGGAGLAAVLISALLLLRFGNRITRELTRFLMAVRALADERLPAVVSRLRRGEDVDVAAEAPPLALRTKTREVARIADAFGAMQRTAVEAAVGQAELRKGVSKVFRSLARRNQSLLQRQLRMLDAMERGTEDPDALAQLFRLDHLTTRMRRQAEGLIILSGAPPGRGWREPVPVVEVLRGAIGEIEDYARVDLITTHRDLVPGAAVTDVTHLLAELIENAALYSPPSTRVRVTAGPVASGFAVEIEDRGLGMPPETMAALNERLANPPEFDLADSDQLGLLVVSLLAARHGIKVTLRGSPYGGISAVVLMPHDLVLEDVPASLPFAASDSMVAGSAVAGSAVAGSAAAGFAGAGSAAAGPAAAGRPGGDHRLAGAADASGASHWPGARLVARSLAPKTTGGHARLPAWREPAAKAAAPLVPRVPREPAAPLLPGGLKETAAPLASGGPRGTAGPLVSRPPWEIDDSASHPPAVERTHRGLPRRVRQANLAPQLREDPPAGAPGGGGTHGAKSAERARALIASIQQGWRSGRADTGGHNSGLANAGGPDRERAGAGRPADGQATNGRAADGRATDGRHAADGGRAADGGHAADGGRAADGGHAADGGRAADGGHAADGGTAEPPGQASPGPEYGRAER
jgi:Nitrate and nitrite sensing